MYRRPSRDYVKCARVGCERHLHPKDMMPPEKVYCSNTCIVMVQNEEEDKVLIKCHHCDTYGRRGDMIDHDGNMVHPDCVNPFPHT